MVHIVSNLSEGKSYRNEKVLKCGHCGFEHDADINAAMNIAALGKSVSLPESLGMSCQLENYLCS
jgi:transposase